MDNYKGFIAGSITGITETLSGHWLDTLKVNSQTKTEIRYKNLYNGFQYACFSSMINNSFIFGFNNYINKKYNLDHFISGFGTGILNAILTCPFENKKIQSQNRIKNINYFRGLNVTLCRDSIGYSSYFGVYNILTTKYDIQPLIAGGTTGVIAWIFTYPIDVLSSRIKSDKTLTIKDAYSKGGLWTGFKFCIIRTILVSSINFYTYDNLMKKLVYES